MHVGIDANVERKWHKRRTSLIMKHRQLGKFTLSVPDKGSTIFRCCYMKCMCGATYVSVAHYLRGPKESLHQQIDLEKL